MMKNLGRQACSSIAISLIFVASATGADDLPSTRVDPEGYIVDAKSVLAAARLDRLRSNRGAVSDCMSGMNGTLPSPAAASATEGNKRGSLVERLKRTAAVLQDPTKHSELRKCSEDAKSNADVAKGLEIYGPHMMHNMVRLLDSAYRASGISENGELRPAASTSQTCVWSVRTSSGGWRPYEGLLTPNVYTVPVVAGKEWAYTVIDRECYAKKFPDRPIPPSVEVLSVHEYFDRIIRSRVSRLNDVGFTDYARRIAGDYFKQTGRAVD